MNENEDLGARPDASSSHGPVESPDNGDGPHPRRHVVVMGVSGSGKTTVAEALREELGMPFAEADDFHPASNIAKMSAQIPLTDEDRWPWLQRLRDWMSEHSGTGSIITCSALRRPYRDVLREATGGTVFLHIATDQGILSDRLNSRAGHFMPPALLASQLSTLEALEPDEPGTVLTNDDTVEALVAASLAWVKALREGSGTYRSDHDVTSQLP